jgi:thiosulfate dehydrogenase
MPLSRPNTLSDQEAWDVAAYMDSHERPQDPRYVGSVDATRLKFHDSAESMYGVKVDGHVIGQGATKPGGALRTGTNNADSLIQVAATSSKNSAAGVR